MRISACVASELANFVPDPLATFLLRAPLPIPQFDDQGITNTDPRFIAVPDKFINLMCVGTSTAALPAYLSIHLPAAHFLSSAVPQGRLFANQPDRHPRPHVRAHAAAGAHCSVTARPECRHLLGDAFRSQLVCARTATG